jgi:hypothetical protein
MGEIESAATGEGDQPAAEPDVSDEAREAGLMRQVQRMQQKHREGGVDPELSDSEPDA